MKTHFTKSLGLLLLLAIAAVSPYTAKAAMVDDNIKPVVVCMPRNIEEGSTFDPTVGISVTDNYYPPSDFMNAANGCRIEIVSSNVDPNTPGLYQVCSRAIDGSGNISELCCSQVQVIKKSTSGIYDISNQNIFTIYPNPTAGKFEIEFALLPGEKANITVINTLGQTIKAINTTEIINGKIAVDMSSAAPGIYFIQIQTGEKVATQKFTLSK